VRLTRLVLERFRNLESAELQVDAPFVVLHGPNAQGKTNALEAVHLLATLKPLRGRRVRDLVRWGEREAALAGWVEHEGVTRHYRVDLGPDGRNARLDGKRPDDLADYFAGVRAITFTPSDERVVSGSPGWRRDWLDRAVFTAQPAHLGRVRTYRRALDQKAALLRKGRADRAYLEVLDDQLAQLGAELVHRRVQMLRELAPHVVALHERIAGTTVPLALRYHTAAKGDSVEERTASLRARLAEVSPRERDRGTTLAGPQLDDVKVLLDEHAARTYGSRGQVRSLVLSLKLAELVAARARGDVPLFLVDDVSSELDRARTGRLVQLLAELSAQVILTTTAPEHLSALPADDTLLLSVADGVICTTGSGSSAIESAPSEG
jgi:DNA replication and repair protein RecF